MNIQWYPGHMIMPRPKKKPDYNAAQIMLEQTDDEHYITMPEIMAELANYGITADRKSIYQDLRDLEAQVSKYEAGSLLRQVFVSGRIKTMNESINYTEAEWQ